MHALPGVVAATETSTLPPYGGIGTDIDITGKTHTERWEAIFQLCSEGYIPTLGLKLLRGRGLSATEVSTARKVAVVNQTFVTRFFGLEDPIGRQVRIKQLEKLQDGNAVENPVFEIVGVMSDAKNAACRSGAAEISSYTSWRVRARHPGQDSKQSRSAAEFRSPGGLVGRPWCCADVDRR